MLGTGNTVPTASGGIWQNTRINPVAPTKCGLNVALILDVSGSVAGSLPALKLPPTTFTNSLVGTPVPAGAVHLRRPPRRHPAPTTPTGR